MARGKGHKDSPPGGDVKHSEPTVQADLVGELTERLDSLRAEIRRMEQLAADGARWRRPPMAASRHCAPKPIGSKPLSTARPRGILQRGRKQAPERTWRGAPAVCAHVADAACVTWFISISGITISTL